MNQLMNQPSVKPPRPKQKRWWANKVVRIPLVCLATLLTIVVVAAGSYYAWAYCSTSSSVLARQIIWQTPANVDDYQRFPARTIATASPTFSFPRAPAESPSAVSLRTSTYNEENLAQVLAGRETTSFLVIKGGQLLYEGYFNGYSEQSTVTSFSVAKSVLSALVGIAIGQGAIGSVQDPITKYLPELAKRDARFGAITIQDLLTMASGLSWHPNQDNPGISHAMRNEIAWGSIAQLGPQMVTKEARVTKQMGRPWLRSCRLPRYLEKRLSAAL